jgi:sterol desaturase/sphingolipid hydroxylase (fatty acid hydroxylase superfamily)
MIFEKIYNKGQAQLFKNRYLEFFTKTHPLVIWMMYLPCIIYLPYYASLHYNFSGASIALIFFGGISFWTFFEYIIHRFVFHWISDNHHTKNISYIIHGNHHEFPKDRQRLFMPALPTIILSAIIFIILFSLMDNNVFVFFPGFILGYLFYASMHYAIHAWPPPFKWLKPIWRSHHLHHYKNDKKGFGVSTHFWDKVFGTAFDLKKEKEDKEAVQKLLLR